MRPQVLAGSQKHRVIHQCTGFCVHREPLNVCTHCHSVDLGKRQPDRTHILTEGSHHARKDTRNKNSWTPIHISIWMFLDGHNVQWACFETWMLLLREMKPMCCKNNCWCYVHVWTNSPCLLPLSTRKVPWIKVLPTRPRVTKLYLRRITQLEHRLVSASGEWEDIFS